MPPWCTNAETRKNPSTRFKGSKLDTRWRVYPPPISLLRPFVHTAVMFLATWAKKSPNNVRVTSSETSWGPQMGSRMVPIGSTGFCSKCNQRRCQVRLILETQWFCCKAVMHIPFLPVSHQQNNWGICTYTHTHIPHTHTHTLTLRGTGLV